MPRAAFSNPDVAMLNTLPVVASSRQPRGIVRLGGSPIAGWISCTVSNNSYYEADTFSVSFAVSRLPASNNADWFSKQTEIFVEILAGFPSNPDSPDASQLTSLIYGRVDLIDYQPGSTILMISGRDLTAPFIDQKLTAEYQNQTASAIVQTLAKSHGIDSQVTSTTTKIGTYYRNEQVRMEANRSEWDFIAWLAREEGFVAFLSPAIGLYFGPDPRTTSNPYVIQWKPPSASQGGPVSNMTGLTFSRSLTVAKGITVTVRSPSLTTKTPVVQSFPGPAKTIQAGKASPFGSVQSYFFNERAGLTSVQAQQIAERRYKEIVSHAMKLEGQLPADVILGINTTIQVQGTGTAFDQLYFPRLITRRLGVDTGFAMEIEAQNTTPELEQANGGL
jgi:Phage tail baseplate hub (GPD)